MKNEKIINPTDMKNAILKNESFLPLTLKYIKQADICVERPKIPTYSSPLHQTTRHCFRFLFFKNY